MFRRVQKWSLVHDSMPDQRIRSDKYRYYSARAVHQNLCFLISPDQEYEQSHLQAESSINFASASQIFKLHHCRATVAASPIITVTVRRCISGCCL